MTQMLKIVKYVVVEKTIGFVEPPCKYVAAVVSIKADLRTKLIMLADKTD